MKYAILVVDDDPTIRKICQAALKAAGHAVSVCATGGGVLPKVRECKPDLLLMDVDLGDADGRDICRELRERAASKGLPIILISGAKVEPEDQVDGLKGGADDYLIKPIDPKVLVAKIEAVLGRFRAPVELKEVLKHYSLTLEVAERRVSVQGKPVSLTRKEFDLLTHLLRNRGRLLKSTSLLESVWGYEIADYNDPHTVQVHISRLKRKLGKGFSSRIENVIGCGYRLN